ncbi:protein-glutamate O-methyltransferase CheR [Sulfitobacter sp. F26204]|uniref:CheR family methyltransferase n=1 Tax=Sulfitobacter sp. F26204 TaxID=2996014 RepID=UPI00225E5C10|nr:protein-glutamate O-methyltransferase CheR [Sulfitobacter sp. F26204]MCX7559772.1 protein-glutamate O-methyltransferase CheR [Sulfitobacter sp. F26204]
MKIRTRETGTLDPDSFRAIAALAYRESGLTLVEQKISMIQSRLRHRLRDLGLIDFASYCALVHSDAGQAERQHLISALTTNVSQFFREGHHFEALKHEVDRYLPRLRAGKEMRIWSAGCANGQEALSVAITLAEHLPDIAKLNLRILATDIDPQVVRFARRGIYPERFMAGVPPFLLSKYFVETRNSSGQTVFAVGTKLMNLIYFNELNLLSTWPMTKKFEVIFCRNVVIYFDFETQEKLWSKFHQALTPQGALFLGHSERINDPRRHKFSYTGPTSYRALTG